MLERRTPLATTAAGCLAIPLAVRIVLLRFDDRFNGEPPGMSRRRPGRRGD